MSRKVYMTEDQLNEILGGAYLDDYSSDGNVKDSGYEITTTNPVKGGKGVTSDEFANDQCRSVFMGRYRDSGGVIPATGALTNEEKKKINEVADGVKSKHYKVSGPLRDKMVRNYQSTNGRTIGTKRLEKLLSDEGASENYLSNLLSDIKAGNVSQDEEHKESSGYGCEHEEDAARYGYAERLPERGWNQGRRRYSTHPEKQWYDNLFWELNYLLLK